MDSQSEMQESILRAIIKVIVNKKLTELSEELRGLTKGMDNPDKAKPLIMKITEDIVSNYFDEEERQLWV